MIALLVVVLPEPNVLEIAAGALLMLGGLPDRSSVLFKASERSIGMLRLNLAAGTLALALCVGCQAAGSATSIAPTATLSSPSSSSSTDRPGPSASASITADWHTLTDVQFGFTLRYPTTWTEKVSQPAGFHAMASRDSMMNLRDLQTTDSWFVARAFARDPITSCGEPVGPGEKADTTLGGLPATRFVLKDPSYDTVDVIALRGSTCYALQFVTGTAIPLDQTLTTLQAILSTYRLTG